MTTFTAFLATDLAPGEMRRLDLPDARALAIYNLDGTFYATDDLCTHGEASLTEEGILTGKIIECSWHFGSFDVTTGEALTTPCNKDLRTYRVRVVEGILYVDA